MENGIVDNKKNRAAFLLEEHTYKTWFDSKTAHQNLMGRTPNGSAADSKSVLKNIKSFFELSGVN